jgi:hypothetical protein
MNLCELYSLTLGERITRPYLNPIFYPLPFGKYIVIQGFSKPSKNWSRFNELIEFIKPSLDALDIKLVSVGGKSEENLPNCYPTAGLTSFGQLEFLIQNSIAFFGVDSIGGHIAGAFDKPRIILISNNYSANVKPFFGSPENQIIIEPPREEGEKPSFSLDEGPIKQVDEIKIETILSAINKLLNIPIPQINSIHFGDAYNSVVHEFVPNCPFNPQIAPNQIIHIRVDFLNADLSPQNYQYILQATSQRKVVIYINRAIDLNIIKQVRPNVALVVYKMPNSTTESAASEVEFIKSLKKAGFQFKIIKEYTPETLNNEQIAELKFQYLDVAPIQFVEKKNVTLDYQDNLFYRTNRTLFANGKTYFSEFAYKNDLTPDSNHCKIENNQQLSRLLLEQEYLYIYQNCEDNNVVESFSTREPIN